MRTAANLRRLTAASWQRMAPRDAQMLWLSERVANDQFLLFAFASVSTDTEQLRQFVRNRVARISDLQIRIHDVAHNVDYPYWVSRGDDIPLDEHALTDSTWAGLEVAVAALFDTTVDTRVSPWRLHIFRKVTGVPGCDGTATVAVLQVSHALADGRRASEIARALFGRTDPAPVTRNDHRAPPDGVAVALGLLRLPIGIGRTVVRGIGAALAQQELRRAERNGEIPGENPGQVLTSFNAAPGSRRIRMIVCDAPALRAPGITVTVAVLTAVSSAMSDHLQTTSRLGAEVTVAQPPTAARNNFRNVGVDLFPEQPDLLTRARSIATALAERRRRAGHPAANAQGAVTRALPAPMLRSEIDSYPLDQVPPTVSGNTVVSSVFRGPADLHLGDGTVLFTAGFPALSTVMGLTHGVHGLGDTVTVSITAGDNVMPDIDRYAASLRRALADVARALADAKTLRSVH